MTIVQKSSELGYLPLQRRVFSGKGEQLQQAANSLFVRRPGADGCRGRWRRRAAKRSDGRDVDSTVGVEARRAMGYAQRRARVEANWATHLTH